MNNTVELVKKVLGIDVLSSLELQIINNYVSALRPNKWTSMKLLIERHVDELRKRLDESFNEYQIKTLGTNAEDDQLIERRVDDQEYSASIADELEVKIRVALEMSDPYTMAKEIAPSARLKYNYLHIDSDNAYSTSANRDSFTWLINDKNVVQQIGYINLHSVLRNIRMARIGRMNYSGFDPTDVLDLVQQQYRFAYDFEEFTSQAVLAQNGVRFQFLQFFPPFYFPFGPNVTMSPFNMNRGWFRFREKIKYLDKLTLSTWFFDVIGVSPYRLIVPDTYYSFSATQLYTGGAGNTLIIPDYIRSLPFRYATNSQTGLPNYATGAGESEILLFSGFTTDDPITDAALIANYNSQHKITRTTGFPNFNPPVNINGGTYFGPLPQSIPITITLIYKPRFNGVLELVSEDDNDDPE